MVPHKQDFLEGREILQVECGQQHIIVLLQKLSKMAKHAKKQTKVLSSPTSKSPKEKSQVKAECSQTQENDMCQTCEEKDDFVIVTESERKAVEDNVCESTENELFKEKGDIKLKPLTELDNVTNRIKSEPSSMYKSTEAVYSSQGVKCQVCQTNGVVNNDDKSVTTSHDSPGGSQCTGCLDMCVKSRPAKPENTIQNTTEATVMKEKPDEGGVLEIQKIHRDVEMSVKSSTVSLTESEQTFHSVDTHCVIENSAETETCFSVNNPAEADESVKISVSDNVISNAEMLKLSKSNSSLKSPQSPHKSKISLNIDEAEARDFLEKHLSSAPASPEEDLENSTASASRTNINLVKIEKEVPQSPLMKTMGSLFQYVPSNEEMQGYVSNLTSLGSSMVSNIKTTMNRLTIKTNTDESDQLSLSDQSIASTDSVQYCSSTEKVKQGMCGG